MLQQPYCIELMLPLVLPLRHLLLPLLLLPPLLVLRLLQLGYMKQWLWWLWLHLLPFLQLRLFLRHRLPYQPLMRLWLPLKTMLLLASYHPEGPLPPCLVWSFVGAFYIGIRNLIVNHGDLFWFRFWFLFFFGICDLEIIIFLDCINYLNEFIGFIIQRNIEYNHILIACNLHVTGM
jgi:hypothetical protein